MRKKSFPLDGFLGIENDENADNRHATKTFEGFFILRFSIYWFK